ncbi:MAG TPA: DMT family transporter [Alphaproteobacteria bacterium]
MLGPALILALAVGWGLNWPVMKIGLLEFPLWTFRGSACLVAGLCLLALAPLAGGRAIPRSGDWRSLAVAAFFNVTIWQIFIAYGLRLVASGEAALLAFTMPLWAVFLGRVVLGETLGSRGGAALILGTAGIVVLLTRDFTALARAPTGVAMVVIGAAAWAVGTLIQKRHHTSLTTVALAGWQLTLGALPMMVMIPLLEGWHPPAVSVAAWLSLTYTTFVALVLCWYLWFKIVSLMPMNIASISTLLVPAVGVISGALMLHEEIGVREILALALIATALALVLTRPAAPAAAADQVTPG